ncbi:hypothetical protein DUNSADRAFT_1052 [Dunaliella salina]|uniref:Encoded protein n=1 Tax=Dunaliella salina TaxID=3046 RepID=A0ABQ7FY34_DUNSA|nr:hypothetical protein DUNSADRAFT_1052 [Dunaliella salina]|eukprot:KAF5827266.1 hypothetical protein DUNSADRAFT_1052 [Dunaliella salina]
MAKPESQGLDFSQFQQELDGAFHSRSDRIPAGTPEHAELMAFAQRFLGVRKKQKAEEQQKAGGASGPNPRAEDLGIPTTYEPRYRVNVAVVRLR